MSVARSDERSFADVIANLSRDLKRGVNDPRAELDHSAETIIACRRSLSILHDRDRTNDIISALRQIEGKLVCRAWLPHPCLGTCSPRSIPA